MADTQSSSSEDVTMQVPHIEFFKTLINVFKENRELLSNLPEVMECLVDNGPAKLVEVHQFEEYRYENLAIIVPFVYNVLNNMRRRGRLHRPSGTRRNGYFEIPD